MVAAPAPVNPRFYQFRTPASGQDVVFPSSRGCALLIGSDGRIAPSLGGRLFELSAPRGGGFDDWADANALVAAAPVGSVVRLTPSSNPYLINHSQILGKPGITLDLTDIIVESTSAYGLGNSPILIDPGSPGNIATVPGVVSRSQKTLTLSWTGPARLVAGNYIWIYSPKGARKSYRVRSVLGDDITLDVGVPYSLPANAAVVKYSPVQDFNVIVNGAQFFIDFDGDDTQDTRFIELISCWGCSVTGDGYFEQVGGVPVAAIVGMDLGGRYNWLDGYTVRGIDGTNGNASGSALEGQLYSGVGRLHTHNVGYGLWINSSWWCNIGDVNAGGGHGSIQATSVDSATPANESGCRENRFGTSNAYQIIGSNGALRLGADCSDNRFDEHRASGNVAGTIAAAVLLGANGSKGCNRNSFGDVSVKDLTVASLIGAGSNSTDNAIASCELDNVSQILSTSSTGSSLAINALQGAISAPEAHLVAMSANSQLLLSNINLRTNPNADGESIAFPGTGLVTLTGATPAFFPAPWANATTRVTATRKSAGGTSHNTPVWSVLTNTTTKSGTAGFAIDAGLASWDGTRMTADNGNSAHDIALPVNATYVRGPAIFRATLKPGGLNWAVLSLGSANYAYFNLTTGAIGTVFGADTQAFAQVNADGTCDCVIYSPDVESQTLTIWMAQADNVISFLAAGQYMDVTNVSLSGINAIQFTAEANNADVYQVTAA